MCQPWSDMHNSVNQYFPNDQMLDVTKLCMSKTSIPSTRLTNGF